jgi:hypothetical protein
MGRACWPDKLELVAIDGKTSRRHNRRTGHNALHLVSAFATNSRLVRRRATFVAYLSQQGPGLSFGAPM